MTRPSLESFLIFVRNIMQVPSSYLPDGAPALQHAYDHSLDIVNLDLALAGHQKLSWGPYELAVYNLGGHILIEFGQDQVYPITSLSWLSGYATATTPLASGILPGDRLSIVGVSPLGYSGPQNLGYVTVQATPDLTHFSYAITPDPGAATLLPGAAAVEQYFSRLRRQLKLGSFVAGWITSTSDLSTSVGLSNPNFLQNLTLENLQLLKTPYGRAYLEIAQKAGPNVWGMS